MKVIKVIGLVSLAGLISCGRPSKSPEFEKLNGTTGNGTPMEQVKKIAIPLMDLSHSTHFESLPLQGTVEFSKRLWSGDHWPLNKGNINRRWNSPDQAGFDTPSPTKEELALFTEEEIARLAPSEKYDLLMGQYDYPLKKEVATRSNPMAVHWEGIGNGWASASANHEEPHPKVLLNPDGLAIPFGSDDIKALLSYYYAFANKLPSTHHLGLRCLEGPESSSAEECATDLNAGSFHATLANMIGIHKRIFLADVDRYQEVWNHPFQAYKSEVMETLDPLEGAPQGTKKTLKIKTKVYYVDRSTGNSWEPIKGSYRQVTTNRLYHYTLHLNDAGEIIGGDWESNDRPDFLWVMPKVEKFEENFAGIAQLLE